MSYFGAKVSQMLINDENGTEIKNLTLSLVKNLKGSFAEIIKEAKWMDAGKPLHQLTIDQDHVVRQKDYIQV